MAKIPNDFDKNSLSLTAHERYEALNHVWIHSKYTKQHIYKIMVSSCLKKLLYEKAFFVHHFP